MHYPNICTTCKSVGCKGVSATMDRQTADVGVLLLQGVKESGVISREVSGIHQISAFGTEYVLPISRERQKTICNLGQQRHSTDTGFCFRNVFLDTRSIIGNEHTTFYGQGVVGYIFPTQTEQFTTAYACQQKHDNPCGYSLILVAHCKVDYGAFPRTYMPLWAFVRRVAGVNVSSGHSRINRFP